MDQQTRYDQEQARRSAAEASDDADWRHHEGPATDFVRYTVEFTGHPPMFIMHRAGPEAAMEHAWGMMCEDRYRADDPTQPPFPAIPQWCRVWCEGVEVLNAHRLEVVAINTPTEEAA